MTTAKPKTERPPGAFVGAGEMANHMAVTRAALAGWMAAGDLPPPWVRPGLRVRLWRRDHWEIYVATGRWPDEAWKEIR